MMDFKTVKEEVERAQRDKSKAEGALEQVLKDIKEKFDCSSKEKAEKLLTQLERDENLARKKYDEAVDAFEEVWDEQLESN